jgi:hypothetical protein
MPVVLRLRDVPAQFEVPLREAIETAIEGDWIVTVSRSHIDGQWHLQLTNGTQSCRVVLPALGEVRVSRLRLLLQDVTAGRGPSPDVSAAF